MLAVLVTLAYMKNEQTYRLGIAILMAGALVGVVLIWAALLGVRVAESVANGCGVTTVDEWRNHQPAMSLLYREMGAWADALDYSSSLTIIAVILGFIGFGLARRSLSSRRQVYCLTLGVVSLIVGLVAPWFFLGETIKMVASVVS